MKVPWRTQSFDPDEYRMSLGEHLEELRKRIILGLIGPFALAAVVLCFGRTLIMWICVPLNATLAAYELEPQLTMLTAFEPFGTYMKVSLIGGLILGLPWLGYQLWQFIAKGLYAKEQKLVVMLMPGSMVLSITGVLFMYFLMLPVCLWFLIGFSLNFPQPQVTPGKGWFGYITERLVEKTDDSGENGDSQGPAPSPQVSMTTLPRLDQHPENPREGDIWIKTPQQKVCVYLGGRVRTMKLISGELLRQDMRLSEYISFVMWLGLAFAISFQLPLVMVLVGAVGLAGYAQMRSIWKYMLLACFVIGAVLTPADPLSQGLLAVPMFALYLFGLSLVRLMEKRRAKAEAESPEAGE